jgi:hypothetical protein
MTRVSQAFYSTAIEHKEVPGWYLASFATPGEAPLWVNGPDGKAKLFRSAIEAELAGFRVMASKLNKSRDVQSFMTGRDRRQSIKGYHAPDHENREPTVQSVFGNKK